MRDFIQLYLRSIVAFFPIAIMLIGFIGLLNGMELMRVLQLVFVGVEIDNFNNVLLSEAFEFEKLELIDKLYMLKQVIFIIISIIWFAFFDINIQEIITVIIISTIIDRLMMSKGREYSYIYWMFIGDIVKPIKKKFTKSID